jgi:hypothetical protein
MGESGKKTKRNNGNYFRRAGVRLGANREIFDDGK